MSEGDSKRGCLIITGVIGGVVLLSVCGGLFAWRAAANAALERELAAIRASNLPTTPEELSDFYALPEGAENTAQLWLAACAPFDNEAFGQAAMNLPVVGSAGPENIPPPGTPWDQLADVERFLAQYAESMQRIHQAAEVGGYAKFDRDFAQGFAMLLPEVQQLRGASRMLKLEAMVRAHRNDTDGTLQSLSAMFAVGRAVENDPILISQLVKMAVDGVAISTLTELLPHVPFNDAQLSQLQQLVRKHDYLRSISTGLKGERVLAMQVFLNPSSLGEDAPNIPAMLPAGSEDLALYLQLMREYVEATEDSWQASQKVSQTAETKLEETIGSPIGKFRYIRTGLLFPALKSIWVAGSRMESMCKLADVILATERYKLANQSYPEFVDELIPMYLSQMPIDPYVASPVQYELRDGYPFVWCLGKDLVDDGGVGDVRGEPDVVLTLNPAAKENASPN